MSEKYDLVILGATFMSFGLAKAFKGKSLIIDEKAKPGFEFIDSYHKGADHESELITHEGKRFKDFFAKADLLKVFFIPEWTAFLSNWICKNNIPVLLFTNVLKIEDSYGMKELTIYNSNGKNKILAKRIIDTRTKTFTKKTLNAIIYGGAFESFDDCITVKHYNEKLTLAEFEMPASFDYPDARERIFNLWANRPEEYADIRIAAVADIFYKKADVKERQISENHSEIYSTYYPDPFVSFDKGCRIGEALCC